LRHSCLCKVAAPSSISSEHKNLTSQKPSYEKLQTAFEQADMVKLINCFFGKKH